MPTTSLNRLSNSIKILTIDAVEKAKSGHPGMPMGFAQVMTSLAFNFLKFNPNDPKWHGRDRLVLSAGHGSMLLYSFFYLAGYKNFNLDDIKNFRQLNSKAAGHPEKHLYEGIETTTGPLGQGVANAVGMAIAQKKLKSELGKVADYKIYAIAGDGCLMEGVSYEALSLAGHLKLDNLIILFDDNNITIDGLTSLAISENQEAKFQAMGFDFLAADGHDHDEIDKALSWAQNRAKPCIIAFKTTIGKDSKTKENSSKAHGAPLGEDEISHLKEKLAFNDSPFEIEQELLDQWRGAWKRNEDAYKSWQENYKNLPSEQRDYLLDGELKFDTDYNIKAEATRACSGHIIANLMKNNDKIIVGSADLAGSNNLSNEYVKAITAEDFSGNFINYGIREHAMAAIMNGLALSGFAAVGGTFMVFSDYLRPSIRLAALMNLPVIYVFTHDSIGVGEDGPTHQPVEHLASLRAIPRVNLFRPCDMVETLACYKLAISSNSPSIFALSRQKIEPMHGSFDAESIDKGGYVISHESNKENHEVTIFATGSEVSLAVNVQKILQQNNISTRVCSVPCLDILLKQDKSYINKITGKAKKLVAIEAGCEFGWHKLIGSDGIFFGVNDFGHSASGQDVYNACGLVANKIAQYFLIK